MSINTKFLAADFLRIFHLFPFKLGQFFSSPIVGIFLKSLEHWQKRFTCSTRTIKLTGENVFLTKIVITFFFFIFIFNLYKAYGISHNDLLLLNL